MLAFFRLAIYLPKAELSLKTIFKQVVYKIHQLPITIFWVSTTSPPDKETT